MSPNWFIGFPVDSAGWYQKVITNVPYGIKRFNPVDLHITFAFLGAVEASVAQKAWLVAQEVGMRQMVATLGPMMPFGNPEKPSAYAFTLVNATEAIVNYMLYHRDNVLAAAGREPLYTPRPHLTVARPPRSASDRLRAVGTVWATSVTPPVVSLTLDKLALYTWADNREIQQFKLVESIKLV
ncbi:MAG: hypothetical protein AAF564_12120 [Bacteroidota bacterium]